MRPGWYRDPWAPGKIRWWSGMYWTRFVQVAPPPGTPLPQSRTVGYQPAPPRFAISPRP
ncbi:MAG: DUF2510 domain-containing protein [Solirubrobacterales bacterium]